MPSAQPNFAPTTANLGFDSKNALAFRPATLRQRSVPLCNAPAATMESFLQSRSRVIRVRHCFIFRATVLMLTPLALSLSTPVIHLLFCFPSCSCRQLWVLCLTFVPHLSLTRVPDHRRPSLSPYLFGPYVSTCHHQERLPVFGSSSKHTNRSALMNYHYSSGGTIITAPLVLHQAVVLGGINQLIIDVHSPHS